MSYNRILTHFVFTTKNRDPLISISIIDNLVEHMKNNASKKEIKLLEINGSSDHIHCLVLLGPEQNISSVAHLLKGESSYWVNQNHLTKRPFHWADEYFAVSIGESQLEALRNYIRGQREHHRTKSFKDEYDEFMSKYGFTRES